MNLIINIIYIVSCYGYGLFSVDLKLLATLGHSTRDKGQRVPSFENEGIESEDSLNYDYFSTTRQSTLHRFSIPN